MSIPLVQNNDKDAINTSIIAIKRNIERINMLLGLSNSEEIDTSEFVKKSDIVDVVEAGNMNPVTSNAVVPVDEVTLGNMQSVTSNAVAEAFNTNLNDNGLVDITSQVSKRLGVNEVKVHRQNNLVYMQITGSYTGVPTHGSQYLILNLPEKYQPKFYQSFPVVGYLSSGNYVYPSRVVFDNPLSIVTLGETAMPTGCAMRFGFIYMV